MSNSIVFSGNWPHEHRRSWVYLYSQENRDEDNIGTYQWGEDITKARQFDTLTEAMHYAFKVWGELSYNFRFISMTSREVVFSGNNS